MRRHLDQAQLQFGRRAHLARIERECAQHRAGVGEDGKAPAGAISEGGDEIGVALPERIGHQVGRNHGLAPEGRGSAGTDVRPDPQPVDGLHVSLRQMRRGAMLQASAVVLQQQHRTEDVGDLRLDEADEPVEHVLERGVEGDHLQHVGLRVAQVLAQPLLRHVAQRLHDRDQAAGLVVDRLGVDREISAECGITHQFSALSPRRASRGRCCV